MTKLTTHNLSLNIKGANLVKDASFSLTQGEFVVLLGPNGAGKTSLIKASLGLEKPTSGQAKLDGENTHTLTPKERARKISYLPQSRPLAWPNRVKDIVALGRFSYGATLGRLQNEDRQAIDKAITDCDISHLANRNAGSLSGGEIARMHCARLFAAQTPLIIADEPIAALDPRHQFRILELIKNYVDNGGGALIVLHDIELAARYASRLIWMQDGHIVADGAPAETLTSERLKQVYNIRAVIDNKLRINMIGPVS